MSAHKPITDQELNEILARCERATKGDWFQLHLEDEPINEVHTEVNRESYPTARIVFESDASFIAAARTDLPRLAAEVRRLKKVEELLLGTNEKLEDALAFYATGLHIAREEENGSVEDGELARKALTVNPECTSV